MEMKSIRIQILLKLIHIHIRIHGNQKYLYSYSNTFESIHPRPDKLRLLNATETLDLHEICGKKLC